MPISHDYTGKVALVTGAAAGIGKASALAFARAGADVVVVDIETDRGNETAREIEAMGRNALFVAADLTDPSAINALFESIDKRFGKLDCAHNNVGFGWGAGVTECSLEDWNKTLALCLTAPFLCMQHEIAMMKRLGGGAIVNTASMAGLRYAEAASAAYTSAKAGVIALTQYAAVAHAKDGIRINAVSPGLVSTEAVKHYMTDEQQIAYASAEQPIGRPVKTDEIAAAVLWLCSESAAMVTGENMCVAGGQQAT